ncbi:hypothetical protein [Priestia aryabhattai]|uniref:hypothetical protein n=1 Tax=Priestia aryabhattai TaxID=412384 RepID=UPI001ADA71AA|nr:hypothetical protein [Priestia aryabhattai]QTL52624.1 hypothetical protein J5Z55_28930 [Priestia aryabhattai]
MIKNICSLLVTLVVSTSLIIIFVVQPFTAHGETNKKEEIEIEYINKELGFSLTLPGSWRDKYNIKITDNSNVAFKVKLNKTYHSEIYDNIFLFTIHVYDESLKTEGGEGSLLGTNNGKSYWMTVDNALFHYDRYDEMFPDATEGDRRMITTMTEQVKDISKSFKMIGEKEAAAEEMEPKEQGAKGQEAEEVTNHETANGIKYTNKKLGFELTLPKFWKDYYIVEENDRGGVTFKFKFDGKVYEDIYLFDIFVENREYSTEEQEMMGDVGILGIGNGKTYLITENLAMDYYNNYDEYFASVPKDGRKILETMSKQKKILHFTVLTAGVAKDNKALAKKAKGDTWKVPKRSTLTKEAKDYSFEEEKTTKIGDEEVVFSIIKTPVDNIKTEVIKKPVSETKYIGINGGFYAPSYDSSIDYDEYRPCSISYYNPNDYNPNENELEKEDLNKNSMFNRSSKNGPPVSRPTLVTYYDKKLRKTKAEIIPAESMKKINDHFKNLDETDHYHDYSNQVIINAIGGKGYNIKHFRNSKKDYSENTLRRTVLAYREENGTVYAYLMVTKSFVTVERLKLHVKKLGFKENESILLDGSGSTSMQAELNGEPYVDTGTEGDGSVLSNIAVFLRVPLWYFDLNGDANRYSYNMIRVIN